MLALRSMLYRKPSQMWRYLSSSTKVSLDDFYVARYDSGHFTKQLATWGTDKSVICFDKNIANIQLNIIKHIDGFQILNLLSDNECDQLIHITDNVLGYTQDAPVSLPYSWRHMSNCNWIVDDFICDTILERAKPLLPQFITRSCKDKDIVNSLGSKLQINYSSERMYKLLGLNNRFRFYRYSEGDYFKPHTDGSWPHSKIVDGRIIDDVYNDGRNSAMTFLMLLSDDYDGGETIFYERNEDKTVNVRTPKGGVLVFFHGIHDLHLLHASDLIQRGCKYMIRTELIFEN